MEDKKIKGGDPVLKIEDNSSAKRRTKLLLAEYGLGVGGDTVS